MPGELGWQACWGDTQGLEAGWTAGWEAEAPYRIRELAQRPTPCGVAPFHSAMAKFAGPRLPLVMKALLCTHSSVYEVQRVTSTAFLAEVGAMLPWVWQGTGKPCAGQH